jgi:hypothetical protein
LPCVSYILHADEKLTAFMELESAIRAGEELNIHREMGRASNRLSGETLR